MVDEPPAAVERKKPRQAATGRTRARGDAPGDGAAPPGWTDDHIRIAASEQSVVSPSIDARASEAHHVTLLWPLGCSLVGSVSEMIACQSGRSVSPQNDRNHSDGTASQSATDEIVNAGPGDPLESICFIRNGASASGAGVPLAAGGRVELFASVTVVTAGLVARSAARTARTRKAAIANAGSRIGRDLRAVVLGPDN
jgi:hypothetical protein